MTDDRSPLDAFDARVPEATTLGDLAESGEVSADSATATEPKPNFTRHR